MGRLETLEEHLAKTQAEILKEKAAQMGRTGRALEKELARLRTLAKQIRAAPHGARSELTTRFRNARSEAERLLWNLKVQREAMGLRNHRDLDRAYPIPELPR